MFGLADLERALTRLDPASRGWWSPDPFDHSAREEAGGFPRSRVWGDP